MVEAGELLVGVFPGSLAADDTATQTNDEYLCQFITVDTKRNVKSLRRSCAKKKAVL